jgi:hypothetical protein
VAAGNPILFTTVQNQTGGVSYDSETGMIVVSQAGDYFICWGAAFNEAGALFAIERNGAPLPAGELASGSASNQMTSGVVIQALDAGDTLSLVSNDPNPITANGTGSNVSAYLTIRQL